LRSGSSAVSFFCSRTWDKPATARVHALREKVENHATLRTAKFVNGHISKLHNFQNPNTKEASNFKHQNQTPTPSNQVSKKPRVVSGLRVQNVGAWSLHSIKRLLQDLPRLLAFDFLLHRHDDACFVRVLGRFVRFVEDAELSGNDSPASL
jgi:hypothetical protein